MNYNYIERLREEAAHAAAEAAVLEVQARVAMAAAWEARTRALLAAHDLEAALRDKANAALRAAWQRDPQRFEMEQ